MPRPVMLPVPAFDQRLITGIRQQPAQHCGSPDPHPRWGLPLRPTPPWPVPRYPPIPADDAAIMRSASPARNPFRIPARVAGRSGPDDLSAVAGSVRSVPSVLSVLSILFRSSKLTRSGMTVFTDRMRR